jgi:hypothetical protein
MEKHNLIHVNQICVHCSIDDSFIRSLHELGHIDLIVEQNDYYVSEEQLKSLETMIYFHTELHINIEGIDAIAHLLKKIDGLQQELITTRNQLSAFSDQ